MNDLSIGESRVFKSPTVIVLGSICAFKSSSFYLMKLAVPTLGTYKLTIIFSRCIVPFISMK
jgi:hypothetical protein